jgi:probable phosphoglycerate mutase
VQLILIRHALPERVVRDDGAPADPPLSAVGRGQAEKLALWLSDERVDALYVSPMRRARETAAPIASEFDLEPRVLEGIAEFDRDSDVYIPMEELKAQDYDRWKALVDGGWYVENDVEGFRRDVVKAIEVVIEENPGGHVAVVCHGGVVNAWSSHVLGLERIFHFDPDYTSVSRFWAARSGERSVATLNETGHLRGHPELNR